jgi:hypothetical protein
MFELHLKCLVMYGKEKVAGKRRHRMVGRRFKCATNNSVLQKQAAFDIVNRPLRMTWCRIQKL